MLVNTPHEEEDYALFGKIVLQWSFIESTLLNILLRLTSPRFGLKCDAFPLPFIQRVKLAKRCASACAISTLNPLGAWL